MGEPDTYGKYFNAVRHPSDRRAYGIVRDFLVYKGLDSIVVTSEVGDHGRCPCGSGIWVLFESATYYHSLTSSVRLPL